MNASFKASLAAVLMALPAAAHAKPVPWGTAVSPACAFTGIVGFNWGTDVDYLGCIGAFSGNTTGSNESNVLSKLTTAWGNGWGVLDAPSVNTATGVLTFQDVVRGRYAVGLKQGNAFSLYLFNADVSIASMRYTSAGVQDGPSTEIDLSHATLYGLQNENDDDEYGDDEQDEESDDEQDEESDDEQDEESDDEQDDADDNDHGGYPDGDGDDHVTPVPEPASVTLLAVGVLGLIGAARQRRPRA